MPGLTAQPESRDPRTPGQPSFAVLSLILGAGVAAGALTLGSAPWGDPLPSAVMVSVLAALGAATAMAGAGVRGLTALHAGLLAGLAMALWLRITMAQNYSGWVSLIPAGEWRVGYGVAVVAGLVAVSGGFVVGDRRRGMGRRIARPGAVLAASLVGSVVLAGSLAVYLGTSGLVIPEGAVTLHVVVTDGRITLDPATVSSGDVYFIRSQQGHRYNGPFLESGTGPSLVDGRLVRGPLTDDDVARLQSGQLPQGRSLAEEEGQTPAGEPPAWPAPDEYGGHEWLEPGRYAWWTLEVGDFPGRVRFKDMVIFTVR